MDDPKALLLNLETWLGNISEQDIKAQKYNAALNSVQLALIETRKYLNRNVRNFTSQSDQERLSELWARAGEKIRPYDMELSYLCIIKSHGWADSTIWDDPEFKKLPIKLNDMLEKYRKLAMSKNITDSLTVPNWFRIAGVFFTGLTIISLFYLIIIAGELPTTKRIIFNVWVAFCAAASFSFIGGYANAHGRLPWLGNSPIRFSVYGGIGVFVIVLIIMYSIHH